ncbi:MAG: hypothetical protein DBX90_08170 [Lentisphaerae bacterium]|nr:MAG: hypothetical protein DBX90_08170 [Lentisphaerota bacterium]
MIENRPAGEWTGRRDSTRLTYFIPAEIAIGKFKNRSYFFHAGGMRPGRGKTFRFPSRRAETMNIF